MKAMRRRLRFYGRLAYLTVIGVLAATLQAAPVLSRGGVALPFLTAWVVAVAVYESPLYAGTYGFFFGLWWDSGAVSVPFGWHALSLLIIGASGAWLFSRRLPRRVLPLVLVTAVCVGGQGMVEALWNRGDWLFSLWRVVLPGTVVSGALSPVCWWLMGRCHDENDLAPRC